jgi:oligosaccharide 4-alpha-D-glucosyltransferase
MKKNLILTLICGLTALDIQAQTISTGQWTATPFPNDVIKLTWTHAKQKNKEQVSNAVIVKSLSAALPVTASKKTTWPNQSFTITGKGTGLDIQYSKAASISIAGGFDSGHIRGLRIQMPGNAPWLGGGERATPLIRNGQRISLYNAPAYGYGEGQDQLNYSVPFVMTTAGYGLFFDNPAKGYIDFGKTTEAILEAAFVSGSLDLYVIAGKSPAEILRKYSLLTGRQPLPPRWALGNFVSRFGYYSQQEAEDVVARMKADSIPMDAIIIDLFWFGDSIQHTLGNLDWNKPKWPEPEKMIEGFAKSNINTILITEPFTVEGTKEYKNSIPYLATDSSGKPYRLTAFYFGKGGVIDIFRKPARDWFWKYYKKQTDKGVAGWWGDLGEPEHHPTGVMHNLSDFGVKRKMSANEVHNFYGHVWSQMVYENWKKDYPDKRLFFLNRAGYAGSQRYSIFPWTGDVSRSWTGFRAQIPTLQSMSLSGVPYIHSDAGGFAMTDQADPELYTRWLQFAAFSPIFRPHGSALGHLTPAGTISLPSEPTFWDDKTKTRARNTIVERYRLLPYNYTLAWEHLQSGKPLMRPMLLEQGDDSNLLKATDQYMWGSALLVAPVLEPGAAKRTLYLPAGTWYRLYDLGRISGGQWVEEPTTMERIPVFVKGGSFLPYWDEQHISSTADYTATDTLTIRYYPGESKETFYYYDDDGKTPGAQSIAGQHTLMEWTSLQKDDTLHIRGNVKALAVNDKRVVKIQLPIGGLKAFIGAADTQKVKITLNNVSYTGRLTTGGTKKDAWMNLYWTTDRKGVDIKISIGAK